LKQEAPKEDKQINTAPSDLIEQFARLEAGVEQLGTAQEMLSWLESAKRQVKAQKHASFYGYRVQLDHRRQECVQLLKLVEAAIGQLDRLQVNLQDKNSLQLNLKPFVNPQGQFVNVSSKTIALHTLSEQLMVDQSRLAALEAALEERLRPFAELDALAFQLNSPTLTVNSESFEQILDKLDTAFEYIEKHVICSIDCYCNFTTKSLLNLSVKILNYNFQPSYKESRAYLSKCSAQRARVVALVRAFVFQALQGAAAGAATNSLDANSFALFYGRFQAVVPRVRPVIALLEARQLQPDYRVLLEQAHQHFVGLREGLLSPSVQASVSDLVKYVITTQNSKPIFTVL
jgi:Sec34-like family